MTNNLLPQGVRFSGHESFTCRFAWLPKAYALATRDPASWADIESAMTELGIGRNMVVSLRFWAEAARVVVIDQKSRPAPTDFARAVFEGRGGDPYLEMQRTLWLVHWHIATHASAPLFAWDLLFGRWLRDDFTRAEILAEANRLVATRERSIARATLDQHFDVFVRSYLPARVRGEDEGEDALDSLLAELSLLEHRGQRKNATGESEPVFVLSRRRRPDLDDRVFAYAVADLWEKRHSEERTLSLRAISSLPGSPGMIFRLPEVDVGERIEQMYEDKTLPWSVKSTNGLVTLVRNSNSSSNDATQLLRSMYSATLEHANSPVARRKDAKLRPPKSSVSKVTRVG